MQVCLLKNNKLPEIIYVIWYRCVKEALYWLTLTRIEMSRLLLNEHHNVVNHCWWVCMFPEQWQKSRECLCRNFLTQGWVVRRPEQTVKKHIRWILKNTQIKSVVNWSWSVSVSVFIQFLNRLLNRLSFRENLSHYDKYTIKKTMKPALIWLRELLMICSSMISIVKNAITCSNTLVRVLVSISS